MTPSLNQGGAGEGAIPVDDLERQARQRVVAGLDLAEVEGLLGGPTDIIAPPCNRTRAWSVSITMTAMTEEAVAEARRVETFEDFFHANYERLLRAMYLATGNRHEAEDLAQDAMARVLERWERVRELEDRVGYVFRVALNRRRSRLRRLAMAIRRTPAEPETAAEPTAAVDDRDMIRRALQSLPDTQREALVLCDWLGMSDAEAGDVLKTSSGAVRTRLHRARAAMRESLGGFHE